MKWVGGLLAPCVALPSLHQARPPQRFVRERSHAAEVTDGIWRRLHLIPFTEQIPDDGKDPNLLDKLRAELPGVSAWCVRGCLEWQRIGLAPPAAVAAATEEYRQEEDVIGRFMEDCLRFSASTLR